MYTSTGGDITITNNIDLSTKGGLVWIKSRSNAFSHYLTDTVRGAGRVLYSDFVNGQSAPGGGGASSFSTTGYVDGNQNAAGITQVSWTFREQAKFFDIVTYTGTGASQTVSHSLNGTVGALIIKKTSGTSNWATFTRTSGAAGSTLYAYFNSAAGLNLTAAANATGVAAEAAGIITTTSFNPNDLSGSGASGNVNNINDSGATYVAYLFAHDAGGFGLTGTDNVISCGSYTGNGSTTGPVVTLGYEPQWLLVKRSSASGDDWILVDNMRGFPVTGNTQYLNPNNSFAESSFALVSPLATGFQPRTTDGGYNANGSTYIYIAIRRGPMKVPTDATKVFIPNKTTSTTASTTVTTNFPVDLTITKDVASGTNNFVYDRLRGSLYTSSRELITNSTAAESSRAYGLGFDNNTGYRNNVYNNNETIAWWNFRRAPSFFDEVCYTGTGAGSGSFALNHNLSTAPELIILRQRNGTSSWQAGTNFTSTNWRSMFLNLTNAGASQTSYASNDWFAAQPTAATFTVGWPYYTAGTYVAYLFASAPGVSKVGSYTGTATTQQINCGFTGGARFVLIKRTDSTGDWYVYDSARGIVAGNDPYLLLNSTAAEVTGTDYVDTYNAGFELSSTAPAGLNANGGTYIFLAIA